MKKTLLLSLLVWCLCVSALAQLPESGNYYRIRNAQYGTVIRENWGTGTLSCNEENTDDYSQLWLYTEDGGLQNVFTGRYIQPQGQWYAAYYAGTTPRVATIADAGQDDGSVSIALDQVHMHCSGEGVVVRWSVDQRASHWFFDEVSLSEDYVKEAREEYERLLAKLPKAGKYYRISSAVYGSVIRENWGTCTLYCKTLDVDDYSQVWLYTNDNALQNVYTGKYMQPQATLSTQFTTGTSAQIVKFGLIDNEELTISINNHNLHCSQSQGYAVVKWNANADASHWTVAEVTLTEDELREARDEYVRLSGLTENASSYNEALNKFFTDELCAELKSEYATMEDEALREEMKMEGLPAELQDIAVKVKNKSWNDMESSEYADANVYAKDFRVASYKPYSDANDWRKKINSNAPSFMGNPTGIYAHNKDVLHVFVGSDIPDDATLYLTPVRNHGCIGSRTEGVALQKGYNVVVAPDDSLVYFVNYVVNTIDPEYWRNNDDRTAEGAKTLKKLSEFPEMDIHIEGGECVGYYEKPKEGSENEDLKFRYLVENAPDNMSFMVKGESTLFYFHKETFVNKWPNTIWNSINWFDRVHYWEYGLIGVRDDVANGLCEDGTEYSRSAHPFNIKGGDAFYPTYCNNPSMAIQGADGTNPHATTYYSSYPGQGGIESSFNAERANFDNWCCGHEHGHHIQGAYNLESCTESSVNLASQLVQYMTGYRMSRGWNFAQNYNYVAQKTPFGLRDISITMRMYWNLYLYYHIAGRKKDFYPTFVKSLREDPMDFSSDSTTIYNEEHEKSAGHHRATSTWIKFYKKACDAAQEDLTEYFRLWGFFEPCDTVWFGDYSNYWVSLSQEEIDAAIAEVKAKKYPENLQIMFIDDRQVLRPRTDIWASEASENQKNKPDSDGTWKTLVQMQNSYGNVGDVLTYIDGSANTSKYEYIIENNRVTMTGNGGVGFIVYDKQGNNRFMSNFFAFDLPEDLVAEGFDITVINADGTTSVAKEPEIQETNQFDPKKLYRVFSNSRNKGYKSWAVSDAGDKGTLEDYNIKAGDQVWQFIEGSDNNAGKYLIYNMSTGRYMQGVAGNSGVALAADVASAKYYTKRDSTGCDTRYAFHWTGSKKNWLFYDGSGNLYGWVDSGHEYFGLEEARIYLGKDNTTYYQPWTMGDNPSPWQADEIDNPTDLAIPAGSTVRYAKTSINTMVGSISVLFQFRTGGSHRLDILGVDLLDEGGKVVASDYHAGSTGNANSNNTYTLTVPTEGDYTLRYIVNNVPSNSELTKTQGNITVTYSANMAVELEALLDIAKTQQENDGDGIGSYTQASLEALGAAIQAAEAKLSTPQNVVEEDVVALQEVLQALEAILPEAGKYYSLVGSSGLYLTGQESTTNGVRAEMSPVDGYDPSYVVYYTGDKLMCYSTGLYLNSGARFGATEDNAIEIAFAKTNGAKFSSKGCLYIMDGGMGINDCTLADGSANHTGKDATFEASANWIIKEVAPSLAITDAKYATFYAPVDVEIPAGISACYITEDGITEETARLTSLEGGIIPACTGVILHSETAIEETEPDIVTYDSDRIVDGNLLTGTVVDAYIEGNAYVLSQQDGRVGLYQTMLNKNSAGETVENGTHFLNNAYKAYLPASYLTAGARRFIFWLDEETSITGVAGVENAEDGIVYDLTGRKVRGTVKGMYIVNGKKVMR